MTIKTFLTIISVIGMVFGVGFLVAPEQIGSIYGWKETPDIQLAGRFFGATLLPWALIGWFARDIRDETALRGVMIPGAIGFPLGFLVTVSGILSGILNAIAWTSAVVYLFGAVGSIYFLMVRWRASQVLKA